MPSGHDRVSFKCCFTVNKMGRDFFFLRIIGTSLVNMLDSTAHTKQSQMTLGKRNPRNLYIPKFWVFPLSFPRASLVEV